MLVNVALPASEVAAASYDARNQRGGDHGAPTGSKQVKVARQLKYKSSDGTDLDRLRAELGVGADSGDGEYDSAAGDYDDEEDDDEPPQNGADAWKDVEDAWPR
jgi:Protein of unknown function (DUF3073)